MFTLLVPLLLLAAAPARALEVELVTGSVAEAALGADRVSAREQRLAARWQGAGLHWRYDYAYRRFEYQRADGRDRDNLHRMSLEARWQGEGVSQPALTLRPVIATSSNVMKEFASRGSSDDWMLHAAATITAYAGGQQWLLGLAYDDAFGGLRAYPRAALLLAGTGWRAELGWPVARVDVRAAPQVELGALVAPAGSRWHVVSDARGGAEFDYVLRARRAGVHARWQSAGGWTLQAQAGIEFDRRLQFESGAGARIDAGAADAPFAGVTLAYRW